LYDIKLWSGFLEMGHEEKEQQEVAANGVDARFGDIENGGKILEDHGGEEREEEEEEEEEKRERHLRRQNLEEESKGKGDQVDAKKKHPGESLTPDYSQNIDEERKRWTSEEQTGMDMS
jgi:hypothetical protein